MEPISWQVGCNLAAAEERVFGEHTINLIHQFQCPLIHANLHVIHRRPADLQQLALLGQAQICAVTIDHRFAFRRAHRFSPCKKIVFDRQFPNFRVKFFDLSLIILIPPFLIGKHPGKPINGLPFPCSHLPRMNLVLRCNLLRCIVST